MADKYFNDSIEQTSYADHREGLKHSLSKNDLELFDDSKNISNTVVRIKRTGSIGKNERWRIIVDDELKFIIDAEKLSKKECLFLRSINGVTFLIRQYKNDEIKSISELKIILKKEMEK